METNKRKRLTIDLDPSIQRRLKVIAVLKGISMRRHCLGAIEKKLAIDESEEAKALPFGEEALNRLSSLQAKVFGGRQALGDSVDLIREARAARVQT